MAAQQARERRYARQTMGLDAYLMRRHSDGAWQHLSVRTGLYTVNADRYDTAGALLAVLLSLRPFTQQRSPRDTLSQRP